MYDNNNADLLHTRIHLNNKCDGIMMCMLKFTLVHLVTSTNVQRDLQRTDDLSGMYEYMHISLWKRCNKINEFEQKMKILRLIGMKFFFSSKNSKLAWKSGNSFDFSALFLSLNGGRRLSMRLRFHLCIYILYDRQCRVSTRRDWARICAEPKQSLVQLKVRILTVDRQDMKIL